MPLKNKNIFSELQNIPSSILSDVLGRFQVVDHEIKPVFDLKKPIIGTAFTVNAMVGCNWGAHIALYKAKPGDILVIDGKGYKNRSIWGGLQSYVAQKNGLLATIVDGAIRDKKEHCLLGYCVCTRAVTPAGPHKGWKDELQVPITCGGVVVHSGDVMVIDNDGIVVIPKDKVAEIVKKAQLQIKTEKQWKKRIDNGEKFYQILKLDKKFDKED